MVTPGLQSHLKLGVHIGTEPEPNGNDDKQGGDHVVPGSQALPFVKQMRPLLQKGAGVPRNGDQLPLLKFSLPVKFLVRDVSVVIPCLPPGIKDFQKFSYFSNFPIFQIVIPEE